MYNTVSIFKCTCVWFGNLEKQTHEHAPNIIFYYYITEQNFLTRQYTVLIFIAYLSYSKFSSLKICYRINLFPSAKHQKFVTCLLSVQLAHKMFPSVYMGSAIMKHHKYSDVSCRIQGDIKYTSAWNTKFLQVNQTQFGIFVATFMYMCAHTCICICTQACSCTSTQKINPHAFIGW
jgi:hypothetical protein